MQSMQLTDWLVVIFIVAIVVVLIDGVRRKLAERRTRVVMKLDRNIPQDVDPDEFPSSELPNGGARAIPREGQPAPSLRTLQAKRKLAFRTARVAEEPGVRAVPVLLDAVDVEEERIEHTNVFADPHAERAPKDEADEFIDGLDGEYEEDAMLAEPEVARKEPGYMDTRYQGRRDDDEEDDYEDDEDEDELEDDDEEDDDLEEFDDDLDDDEEDDEDDDDLDDDDDDDELDDDEEDDDDFDDEDEDDEEEDDEDDEELDELEGLPEDEWGAEEEQDLLVDDYENEPMPLQGAFDKAASQFDRAASHLDKVASQAASQFDKVANHAVNQFDKAATQAATHFNRPPRQDTPRIEPGFGDDDALGTAGFDDSAFTEDFSGAWDEATDAAGTGEFIARTGDERSASPAKSTTGKRDQAELFSAAKDSLREESRLLAALQKAVPRAQPAPVQAAAPAAAVPQEVIIINVMARPGQVLQGGELLKVLQQQGLRLGDMSIFHRHADSHGSGPTMFSMANMVKPGTFDLATMDEFSTPGVSFFLQMPNKLGNMACFDRMLGAASAVRDAFDAELKDEHRSVFTRQTVEHCRQRVRDFELKLLSRK